MFKFLCPAFMAIQCLLLSWSSWGRPSSRKPSLQHTACSESFPPNSSRSNNIYRTLNILLTLSAEVPVYTFLSILVRLILRVRTTTEVCQVGSFAHPTRRIKDPNSQLIAYLNSTGLCVSLCPHECYAWCLMYNTFWACCYCVINF